MPRSPSGPPGMGAPHLNRPLLTAWLLWLLSGSESYGWALLEAVRARGVRIDRSSLYRTLRDLERRGAVTSHWMESEDGPRRRCYRVTADGQQALAERAAQIMLDWQQDEAFLDAHRRALARREHAGSDEQATAEPERPPQLGDDHDAPAAGVTRPLLAGWLLLLLEDGMSHGYDLRRTLGERRLHPDPAMIYRLLRELERAGWVQSRWMRPISGPRRRVYRIRAEGRRNLDGLVGVITTSRDSRAVFLRAYEQARDELASG